MSNIRSQGLPRVTSPASDAEVKAILSEEHEHTSTCRLTDPTRSPTGYIYGNPDEESPIQESKSTSNAQIVASLAESTPKADETVMRNKDSEKAKKSIPEPDKALLMNFDLSFDAMMRKKNSEKAKKSICEPNKELLMNFDLPFEAMMHRKDKEKTEQAIVEADRAALQILDSSFTAVMSRKAEELKHAKKEPNTQGAGVPTKTLGYS